ncbi:hypothetical protein ACFX4Y_23150 [Priestia sp. YIM B13446]|uniref:hypothetical protein n=1 Tax=Priestia sp. YIM B13552 TaxID=3366309 RepID=UPI00366AB24B
MKKELLFESYVLLFDIEITLASIIEKEMTTHYGHLWRQIFLLKVEPNSPIISPYYSN